MTDRINGFWVALAENTSVDDAEATIAAVRMIKGVIAVEPHVASPEDWIAEERVQLEWRKKIYGLFK